MSNWPASKAQRVKAALERFSWRAEWSRGSHAMLEREGWPDYEFAFPSSDEIGPKMLAKIAKHTKLHPTASELLQGILALSIQSSIQVKRGADQTQMGKGLREVAERLPFWANLLCE